MYVYGAPLQKKYTFYVFDSVLVIFWAHFVELYLGTFFYIIVWHTFWRVVPYIYIYLERNTNSKTPVLSST